MSDGDDNESVASRSRSPSAHSVQSRTYSEPEPCSDWLLLDDVSATRGYSSEVEACRADDAEDESTQQNVSCHRGASNLDSSPVIIQHADAASDNFTQELDNCFVASATNQNPAISDSVKPTVVKDAFLLSDDGSNSG